MIAVVQRVTEASVTVEAEGYRAEIGRGLCVLLGVERGDTAVEAEWIAAKIARLRVFPDDEGRMNHSVEDIAGRILLVSQFTLAGDCSKGNRPSFIRAADPKDGQTLYEHVAQLLHVKHGIPVKQGIFGAMMQVALVNDGPVTLIIQRSPEENR